MKHVNENKNVWEKGIKKIIRSQYYFQPIKQQTLEPEKIL